MFAFEAVDIVEEIYVRASKQKKLPPLWDWKEMIGKLARYSTFQDPDGEFRDVAPRFKNRRRIWKLLEMIEQHGTESPMD